MKNDLLKTTVEAGAALLDNENPGWHRKIDCDTLRLQSCYDCMLGQLFGSYGDGILKLNLRSGAPFGFALTPRILADAIQPAWKEWSILTRLWLEEIEARLLRDDIEA